MTLAYGCGRLVGCVRDLVTLGTQRKVLDNGLSLKSAISLSVVFTVSTKGYGARSRAGEVCNLTTWIFFDWLRGLLTRPFCQDRFNICTQATQ